MMALYHTVANVMERLGIQPIKAEEMPERRHSLGRRKQDSGWQFLDHAILTLIEACVAFLLYATFFAGGGQ